MRVAIVTRYFLPVKGGIENHCYNLAKELVKKNVKVEIHTSKDTLTNKNTLVDYEIVDNIVVRRHKRFWKITLKDWDVIHLHNFNIFPHFWFFLKIFLRRLLRKKVPKLIITTHGGFTPWWKEFSSTKRLIKKAYHKTLGKFFLNKVVDTIIAVSEWEKEQLIKENVNPNKITVIPNGVEDLAYELPPQECKELEAYRPYILFMGRISKRKNIEFIIECLRNCKGIYFLIVGPTHEKEYHQQLIELVKEHKLDKIVKFIGERGEIEKYKLIDCSLTVALVSHYETEGIIVKEAIVRGKPVIVSNKTALPYVINNLENGFVISNKEEFINAITLLLKNRNLYNKISRNNKLKGQKWRWRIIAKQILEIYR
mgnify:CR=1 FL=1